MKSFLILSTFFFCLFYSNEKKRKENILFDSYSINETKYWYVIVMSVIRNVQKLNWNFPQAIIFIHSSLSYFKDGNLSNSNSIFTNLNYFRAFNGNELFRSINFIKPKNGHNASAFVFIRFLLNFIQSQFIANAL